MDGVLAVGLACVTATATLSVGFDEARRAAERLPPDRTPSERKGGGGGGRGGGAGGGPAPRRSDRTPARADAGAEEAAVRSAAARLVPWIGASEEAEVRAAGEPGFSPELPGLAPLEESLSSHPGLVRDRALGSAAGAHLDAEKRA